VEIIADATAIDRDDSSYTRDMELATFRNPGALIFKGKQVTTVSAWVCSECGFIEFYADSPARLKLPKA